MLANNGIKSAYKKFHAFSRIVGNKKLVFNPFHKDDVQPGSLQYLLSRLGLKYPVKPLEWLNMLGEKL